ncbi:MAG: hypothetical protein Q8N96_00045 [Methylovulum sp.]|nr:hypothetical protein [Methylovulum sp.]
MLHTRLFPLIILLSNTAAVNAGTLNDGQWSPGCEPIPEPPVLETTGTLDAYNESVKKVNGWQQLAQAYMACLVNEANADNEAIAKAANTEQAKLKVTLDKIKADAAASKFQKK